MGWPNFFPQFWSQFISKSHKPHSCTVICFYAYLNVDRCKQSYLLWVWFKLNLQFLLEILGSNPPRFFFGLTWYLILCHVSEDAQNIHLDFLWHGKISHVCEKLDSFTDPSHCNEIFLPPQNPIYVYCFARGCELSMMLHFWSKKCYSCWLDAEF